MGKKKTSVKVEPIVKLQISGKGKESGGGKLPAIKPFKPEEPTELAEVPKSTEFTEEDLLILSENDPEFARIISNDLTITDFLKKGEQEPDNLFKARSDLAKKISTISISESGKKVDLRTAMVLGSMFAQKAFTGVTYSDRAEKILKFILSKL